MSLRSNQENRTFFVLLLLSLIAGCQVRSQVTKTGQPAAEFAIYLLDDDLSPSVQPGADLSQLDLQEEPILTGQDLLSYSMTTHELELTRTAYDRIQRLFPTPVNVSGTPFVVCLGQDPVYAGAFWTPLSSLSYGGVVILQPFGQEEYKIQISLGYPGPGAFTGKDPRADSRLMNALEAEGKLK
jgi:hypothetical protein